MLLISIAQKSRCARDLGEMVNHQIAELKIFVQQEIREALVLDLESEASIVQFWQCLMLHISAPLHRLLRLALCKN